MNQSLVCHLVVNKKISLPVVAVVAEMEVAVETAHIGFVVAVVEPLFGC